jgi:hypothetical protein
VRSADRAPRSGAAAYDRSAPVPADDFDYPRRPVNDYDYDRAPPSRAVARYRSPSPVGAPSAIASDRYAAGRDRDSRYEVSSRDRPARDRDFARDPVPRDRDYPPARSVYDDRDPYLSRERDYQAYEDPRLDRRQVDRFAEPPRRDYVRERSPIPEKSYGRGPSPTGPVSRGGPRDYPDRSFAPRDAGYPARKRSRSFSPNNRGGPRPTGNADRNNDVGCYCCGSFEHRLKNCPQGHQSCFFCKQKGHVNSNCPSNPRIQRCYSCGDPTHTQQKCRHRDSTCYHCRRVGHIDRACPELGGLKKLDDKVRSAPARNIGDGGFGGERNFDRRNSGFRREEIPPRRD